MMPPKKLWFSNDYSMGEQPVKKFAVIQHPPEVWEVIKSGLRLGETKRVLHRMDSNGFPCSINKTPALSVSRNVDGVFYCCHRCGEVGKIKNSEMSPNSVVQLIEYKKRKDEEKTKLEKVPVKNYRELPQTFLLSDARTPHEVQEYVKAFDIESYNFNTAEVGYSKDYDRIIFPCYAPMRDYKGAVAGKKLIGWAGKCYHNLSKDRRAKEKRPKWFVQKAFKYTSNVVFNMFKNYDYLRSNPVVFVEYPFSAMAIYRGSGGYKGLDTTALLGVHLHYNIVINHRKTPLILWLDPDMHERSKEIVKRYSSLGFKITGIRTNKDPKDLPRVDVRQHLERAIKRVGSNFKLGYCY